MCRYVVNSHRQSPPDFDVDSVAAFSRADIVSLHQSLPEYTPTPLVTLPALARKLGVGQLLLKDESQRFGLRAFKGLGASYAIYRFVADYLIQQGKSAPPPSAFYSGSPILPRDTFTFCTATDGNHGRGVAWVARKLGQRAVVFMPHGSESARVEAIESEEADVIIVDGDYDATVRASAQAAADNRWQIVSDTAWPGYTKIPQWIAAGYLTMFREINSQTTVTPDVVIVQGGVGALASAAAWFYRREFNGPQPKLVSVESTEAACLLESAESFNGQAVIASGDGRTIMAGLNCGTPSATAWPIIRACFDAFVAIGDDDCRDAMSLLRMPLNDDPIVDTGESGAAGLAAVLAICRQEKLAGCRDYLNLSGETTVLVLNTEGDTAHTGSVPPENR